MVKRDHGEFDDVVPLPVSTREPGDGAGLLANGSNSSDKRIGTFDVEFDIEDDVLLHWQHSKPDGWLWKRLPRSWQQVPEWWLRLSKQQRNLVVSGAVALVVLTVCIAILGAAWAGQEKQHTPHLMAATDSPYCSWTDLYLPKSIRPNKYTLHIKSTLQAPYAVTGQVDIQLQASEATPCVVLHAHGMDINAVEFLVYKQGTDLHKQHPASIQGTVRSRNKTSQQVILQFPQAVPAQPLVPVLRLQFSYKLQEGLDGFYRSSYIDAANETKVMASTQFESVAARKAFPCFDEPGFKAVFEVKVSAPPPPVVVLANMPLSHTHQHDGRRRLLHGDDHDDHEHDHEHENEEEKHGHEHDKEEHGHEHETSAPGSVDSGSQRKRGSKVLTEDDLIAYHFHPTPPMSSYLVAWVVGELSHNERQCELELPPAPVPSSSGTGRRLHHEDHILPTSVTSSSPSSSSTGRRLHHEDHKFEGVSNGKRNVTVRVWGTSDRVQQFGHARDVACAALQEMEQLTQVAYPLPKLDLVAIPNFAAGAMENWGLLMYRERSLLVDDSKDDMHQRYAIATTVAHETAHQWLGNLATLDDWTELWINEGFATYMESVLADAYQPSMGYLTNFFTDTTSEGLEVDGSLASHPLSINRPIRQLSEVDNWFDSVSYNKGGAVLRMLRAWLNRDSNSATGLTAEADAPSAAAGDAGKYASTSQQWVPHLRRLLQLHNSVDGTGSSSSSTSSKVQAAGVPRVLPMQVPSLVDGIGSSSSMDGSSSSSSVIQAAGVPRVLPMQGVPTDTTTTSSSSSSEDANKPPASWTANRHFKGPSLATALRLPAETPEDTSESLHVMPPGAPPPTTTTTSNAAMQMRLAAPSVGNTASWGLGVSQPRSSGSSSSSSSAQRPPMRELDAGTAESGGGPDKFMAGLGGYVRQHAFGNSNYTGVWDSFGAAAGEPVGEYMSTWTLRRGFPIVTVSLGAQDSGSSRRTVKVEQVPYHAPRTYMVGLPFEPEMYCNDWSDDPQDSSWWIPLPIRLPGVNNFEWHSFNSCSSSIEVDMPRNTQPWVLANTGRFGFYRVNYSEPLWTGLAAAAASPQAQISSVDFAGLLDDAYSLSHVRQLNITIFLNLVKTLGTRARPELPPWRTALGWLQRMSDVLSTAALLGGSGGEGQRWKDCMSDLRKFVSHKVAEPFIDNVEVPGQDAPGLTFQVSASDPPELRLLRPLVLEAAGFLGYTQAMNTAVDLVAQQAGGDAAAVAPDVAKAVYALAAASGSETAYKTLVNMYEQATDAADKDRALRALARVTTKTLISKTLEYSLSPAVRSQDVGVLLVRLAKQGGLGFNMTWQFVIDRADDILERFGGEDATYALGRNLNDLARLFVDEALLDRLKALSTAKPGIFSPTFFDEANEARMLNFDWLRFQGRDACKWLASALRH